ncbi:sulfatase-like hydrolase/transferase [Gilvimarinus agarilyticus]|uniref:sulfatase-like hydrolase/transferase n=1 Tax=Gilvimarinus agarilyticus TaxID=679259 RepID=UPI0005A23C99|nr:sulfatase-like hydrolase/transferase [Gilvimarinus agarilyticus]
MDEAGRRGGFPFSVSGGIAPLPKRYGLFAVLALVQALLVVRVALQEQWSWLQSFYTVAVSVFSVVVFFLLWYSALSHLRYRWTGVVTKAVIALYALMVVYHWLRLEPLSFLIIYKNGADIFSWQAVGYLLSNATWLGWATLLTVVLALVWLCRRYEMVNTPLKHPAKAPVVVALLLLNIVSVAAFSSSRNELVEFSASVYHYFAHDTLQWDSDNPYPYVKQSDGINDQFKLAEAPNVFVVMLESFSAEYIDKVENGRPVTPFFNALKNEGFYLNNFFSGSVETSKGQFATLCSVYPSYRSNVFTSYPDNNFRCLSHILQERGYRTVFMKAFHSLGFENTGNFVRANGFEFAHGMDDSFVAQAERDEYVIGWGVRDDIFYQKTFAYLDKLQESEGSKAPFFVSTMSVTNHMMFDDIPPEHRYIHADPQSHQDNYANSMYLTDQYLKVFFDELRTRDYLQNSVVVVLGDNGFPMGQHNNFHNTKTAYNELFKTPVLIWWPAKVEPEIKTDTARSQLDVAPTITDLLAIDTTHHFVGRSLFDAPDENYFVPLIQPFDGTYIASIRYPYKYVKHQKTGAEFLFDLSVDPTEKHDLLANDDARLLGLPLGALRQDIQTLRRNEVLLQEDRVYPGNDKDNVRVILAGNRLGEGQPLLYRVLGDADNIAVVVTVSSHMPKTTRRFLAAERSLDEEVSSLDGIHLQPGVNRLTFEVFVDGVHSSTMSEDVLVSSQSATLLADFGLKGKQGWGTLHVNRNVRGGPLRVAGTTYGFGLGTHAASDYTIALDRNYEALFFAVGIDDGGGCGNGATFSVEADGRVVYRSKRLKRGELASALVNISGARALRLRTHDNGNSACDHTNWINPVLYRHSPVGR